MVNTAYFDPAVGGTGLTVTDDGNPTTGLDNDGHRVRFVPALAQVVAVAQHVVDTAEDVNVDKLAAQQAVIDAQGHASLARDKAGIATTKAGEAAASALSASNSAIAASDSADEAEYWAGQAGASVTGGVKVSGTDTTAKPLFNKIQFLGGTSTILNQGGDEVLLISVAGGGCALLGDVSAYVNQTKTYSITDYNSFSTYSVSASAGTASIAGDQITFNAPSTSQSVTLIVTKDGLDFDFSINVLPSGVQTPTNVSPSNGATDQNGSVTLTASAFSWLGVADTHASSDWQVATDSGFTSLVTNVIGDTVNKTSCTVTGLSTSQTYYWRVRYTGTNNGTSDSSLYASGRVTRERDPAPRKEFCPTGSCRAGLKSSP